VIVGVGAVMVKDTPLETTPPEETVTVAVPAVAIRLAGAPAVNWVALPKVVLSAAPFHCTTAPETKPVPLTVSVNAAPPAAAVFGFSDVIVGGGAVMVKDAPFETVPPEETVTVAVPAAAIKLAGTAAVNCVALPKVVVRVAPFHRTTAPEAKPVPLTISVNAAPPATAVFGFSDVMAGGVEELTTNVTITVTEAAPDADMEMLPVYVLGFKPQNTDTPMAPGVVPLD
jgi:hypothetical protein